MIQRQEWASAFGTWLGTSIILALAAVPVEAASGQRKPRPSVEKSSPRPTLDMSEAIVCDSIDGYEDYKVLPGAALTSDEKLLIYYRPSGYRSVLVKGYYQAHFTQDFQIRRRGEKAVLSQKPKMEYISPKSQTPPVRLYITNSISLKGLKPGDYDLLIVLHDEADKGQTATQTVKFRVIPAQDAREKSETKDGASRP